MDQRKWLCFHATTDSLCSIFPAWPALQGMVGLFFVRILVAPPKVGRKTSVFEDGWALFGAGQNGLFEITGGHSHQQMGVHL